MTDQPNVFGSAPKPGPLEVLNPLPRVILAAVSPQEAALAKSLTDRANKLTDINAGTLDEAARVMLEAQKVVKLLESAEDALVKPAKQTIKAISAIVSSVVAPLEQSRTALRDRVANYERAQAAERQRKEQEARLAAEAAARKAREEAEVERARMQAIADTKAKEEAAELSEILGKKVEVQPAPQVIIRVIPPAPVLVPVAQAAPSATRTVTKWRAKVTDASLIPRVLGGIELMKPDMAAIERLMRSDIPVLGVTKEEYQVVMQNSRGGDSWPA